MMTTERKRLPKKQTCTKPYQAYSEFLMYLSLLSTNKEKVNNNPCLNFSYNLVFPFFFHQCIFFISLISTIIISLLWTQESKNTFYVSYSQQNVYIKSFLCFPKTTLQVHTSSRKRLFHFMHIKKNQKPTFDLISFVNNGCKIEIWALLIWFPLEL